MVMSMGTAKQMQMLEKWERSTDQSK